MKNIIIFFLALLLVSNVTTSQNQHQLAHSIQIGFAICSQPAPGRLDIDWAGQTQGHATMVVTDVYGNEIFKNAWNILANTGRINLNVSGLSNGLYFINITAGHNSYGGQFVLGTQA